MPEEAPQLPVSEQEVQIPASSPLAEESVEGESFFEKLKIHKLKILAGFLGFFVFAGAVFGAYKLGQRQIYPELVEGPTPTAAPLPTPTPDPTANWKTYTNTKLGFSIKHPRDWLESTERLLATRTEVEFTSGVSIGVGVVYDQAKQRELTYLEIAQRYSDGKKEPQLITVDGQPAAYLKMREEDLVAPKPDQFNLVTTQKERTVYMIYYSFSAGLSKQEHEQIFNLMLSTFRFLEEITPTPAEFTCPPPGILNCMPGPERSELKYCSAEYSAWIETNCPGVEIVW